MGEGLERKSGICSCQTCGLGLSPEALVGGNLRDVNARILSSLSTPATQKSPNIHKVSQKIHTYRRGRLLKDIYNVYYTYIHTHWAIMIMTPTSHKAPTQGFTNMQEFHQREFHQYV